MAESVKQNLIAAVLIGVSIAIVLLLTPATNYQPHGIISSLKQQGANVKPTKDVIAYKAPPLGVDVVGYFSIELFNKNNPVTAQERMVKYAEELAGQIGAQGIVVEQIANGGDIWYLNGKAIGGVRNSLS